MRYDLYHHLASSAMHGLRMLQEVADDPNVQKVAGPHANAGSSTPNLGGCVDSPEASTIILMLVGTVGIYVGSMFFARMARKWQAAELGPDQSANV